MHLLPQVASAPKNGTLTLNSNGTFTYVPNPGFYGVDTFTYTATNGTYNSNVATVTIDVIAPPIAVPESFALEENGSITVPVSQGVLAGDTDPNGLALTAAVSQATAHGTLVLHANGSFTYTPAPAPYNGMDSFVYEAVDPYGYYSTATVQILIIPTPGAADYSYSYTQAGLSVAAAQGVLSDNFPVDNNPFTRSSSPQPRAAA